MSLTFDFPQWKLRVTGDDKEGEPQRPVDPTGGPELDWAADLQELDSDVDETDIPDGEPTVQAGGEETARRGPEPARSAGNAPLPYDLGPRVSHSDDGFEVVQDAGAGACAALSWSSAPDAATGIPNAFSGASAGGRNLPPRPAVPGPRPPPSSISGDSIPAEVLLLVLSELRGDVSDVARAGLVCKHWLAVVTLSQELWLELHARHLAGGTWHRPPYAGRPLLRPPPGLSHERSQMLMYKTTCALTPVAVRFMALRKGFEYVVEAAASLWLAARRAAEGPAGGAAAAGAAFSTGRQPPTRPTDPAVQPTVESPRYSGPQEAAATPSPSPAGASQTLAPALGRYEAPDHDETGTSCGAGAGSRTGGGGDVFRGQAAAPGEACGPQGDGQAGVGGGDGVDSAEEAVTGGASSRSPDCDGGRRGDVDSPGGGGGVGSSRTGTAAGGSGGGGGGGGRGRRITHVDQLWESCGRGRAALQVDERFNAVRVQQMVGKLCCSGASQWLPLYEGVAAVMASRCDELRDELARAAAAAAVVHAVLPTLDGPLASEAWQEGESAAGVTGGAGAVAEAATFGIRRGNLACTGSEGTGSNRGKASSSARRGRGQAVQFRGEVVYGGSSYADQFAELLRRGDTRGALALGASQRSGLAGHTGVPVLRNHGGGCGSDGASEGELDEPEMREVVIVEDYGEEPHQGDGQASKEGEAGAAAGGAAAAGPLPSVVEEGLMLWRHLLRAWAVYRRWLEVLVVWCGPLGARVEAERQLAGAAAAHGEALLAAPHLTNKGLLLFRSQVLLAYPLRRPLQAAALWLAARAALTGGGAPGYGGGGGGRDSGRGLTSFGVMDADSVGLDWGSSGEMGGGGRSGATALTEEHGRLLIALRKVLTELAVPDDTTQPAHLHTRQKLQRCFGSLLLRPVPGGSRALLLAQRLRASKRGGGGGSSRS